MTRECDDSRHSADQLQHSGLTWERIHADEQYERTSHNFGHQRLAAGLSFDIGGAQISLGTGGRYGRHAYQGDAYYGNTYSPNYTDSYDYNNYNSRYSPDYRGYQRNRGYDNSYRNDYGQVVSPQIVYTETATSRDATRYYYEQLRNQQRYQDNYNDGYQYDSGYQRPYNNGYQNQYNDSYQPNYYNGQYRNSEDRYLIRVTPDDQYYAPSNNRFDLQYTGSNNGYDRGYDHYDRYDRYNSGNDRYIIDSPSSDYSRYGDDGHYQASRFNLDYDQYNNGDRYDYQNHYSQNQYQRYRYPNEQYADQYDNGYYGGRNGYENGYYSDGSNNGSDWMRMRMTLQSMLGHSPREFNRNVSDDLGCATIVSAALRRAHGVNICDTSVDGLENSLRRNGYEAIPLQYAKPGDCIIAHRAGNRHGHAAIYVGDGKVVNNSSAQGRVVVAPIQNFASRDYQSVVAYRRV